MKVVSKEILKSKVEDDISNRYLEFTFDMSDDVNAVIEFDSNLPYMKNTFDWLFYADAIKQIYRRLKKTWK